MGVNLKHEDISRALMLVKNNPGNEMIKNDYLAVLDPVIRLTAEKFPSNSSDDMKQEIRIFLMRRAEYIAKAFFDGKIDNITNYLYRVCYNSAMNYFKRESKHITHIIPIDDVKIEPIYNPKTYAKQKVLDEVRELMLSFIKTRFTDPVEQKQAERFLVGLMEGKRPSFDTKIVIKFAKSNQYNAKDTYSIVLMKMRELLEPRITELLS